MGVASKGRPAGEARWSVSGIAEAPVADISRLLLDVQPGPVAGDNCLALRSEADQPKIGPMTLTGGPRAFVASYGYEGRPMTMTVDIDPGDHSLAVQGQWWYHGEYQVHDDQRGSRIDYRVWNIAGGLAGRAVPLMQRGQTTTMRGALDRLLRLFADRLDCRTYLL